MRVARPQLRFGPSSEALNQTNTALLRKLRRVSFALILSSAERRTEDRRVSLNTYARKEMESRVRFALTFAVLQTAA